MPGLNFHMARMGSTAFDRMMSRQTQLLTSLGCQALLFFFMRRRARKRVALEEVDD
jgi:hypothetical protein